MKGRECVPTTPRRKEASEQLPAQHGEDSAGEGVTGTVWCKHIDY